MLICCILCVFIQVKQKRMENSINRCRKCLLIICKSFETSFWQHSYSVQKKIQRVVKRRKARKWESCVIPFPYGTGCFCCQLRLHIFLNRLFTMRNCVGHTKIRAPCTLMCAQLLQGCFTHWNKYDSCSHSGRAAVSHAYWDLLLTLIMLHCNSPNVCFILNASTATKNTWIMRHYLYYRNYA